MHSAVGSNDFRGCFCVTLEEGNSSKSTFASTVDVVLSLVNSESVLLV